MFDGVAAEFVAVAGAEQDDRTRQPRSIRTPPGAQDLRRGRGQRGAALLAAFAVAANVGAGGDPRVLAAQPYRLPNYVVLTQVSWSRLNRGHAAQ